MWALSNRTPYAVDRAFVRDLNGAEVWLVAIKGTFRLGEDRSVVAADKQEPVLHAPLFCGDPSNSSLRYESDMLLTKPTTDVVLHGSAYAPGGQPTTELLVGWSVGALSKTLRVRGDRSWSDVHGDFRAPSPFVRMPIVYERAYGGLDPRDQGRLPANPIGTGRARGRSEGLELAPNVEYPDEDARRPAGFGPIARHWSPRRELAGTYDAAWMEQRRPLVPADFDVRFFQAAPEDQRPARPLVGGEWVQLSNLTPEGYTRFRLPRVPLLCVTSFRSRQELQNPILHSLILEPELRRLLMVWHMALPCHQDGYELRGTRVVFKTKVTLDGASGRTEDEASRASDEEEAP